MMPSNLTSIKFKANMWHVFIRPLIELCLYFKIVNTETKNKMIIGWARSTFKSMCGLAKTTKNEIVELLMDLDLEKLMEKKIERAHRKWHARIYYEHYEKEEEEVEDHSTLEYVPEEMIKVANILNRACCKECTGQRLTLVHLDTRHDISIPNVDIEKYLRMMIRLKKGTNTK